MSEAELKTVLAKLEDERYELKNSPGAYEGAVAYGIQLAIDTIKKFTK